MARELARYSADQSSFLVDDVMGTLGEMVDGSAEHEERQGYQSAFVDGNRMGSIEYLPFGKSLESQAETFVDGAAPSNRLVYTTYYIPPRELAVMDRYLRTGQEPKGHIEEQHNKMSLARHFVETQTGEEARFELAGVQASMYVRSARSLQTFVDHLVAQTRDVALMSGIVESMRQFVANPSWEHSFEHEGVRGVLQYMIMSQDEPDENHVFHLQLESVDSTRLNEASHHVQRALDLTWVQSNGGSGATDGSSGRHGSRGSHGGGVAEARRGLIHKGNAALRSVSHLAI